MYAYLYIILVNAASYVTKKCCIAGLCNKFKVFYGLSRPLRGPVGGTQYVYTQKYTDQENHLLTTSVCICDHILIIVITLVVFFSFYKILLDMLYKMCKTMYNWYI